MTKQQKAAAIVRILDKLYPTVSVQLHHRNPFTFLIAVLLSGQSTDKKVNQITPALFDLADTPEKMARLRPASVEKIIRPCGLAPAKSKNIVSLSKILVARHGGHVPGSFEELEALPGVGHKTASVIMSQCFGQPAFPVDTHIHRLAYRWGLSNGKNVVQTEKDLKRLFPQKRWNKLHLQMIFFGREHCPALRHDFTRCLICRDYGRKSLRA